MEAIGVDVNTMIANSRTDALLEQSQRLTAELQSRQMELQQSNADITTTLAAGETASGWMALDVPSRHGKIVYSPNADGQPIAEWSY